MCVRHSLICLSIHSKKKKKLEPANALKHISCLLCHFCVLSFQKSLFSTTEASCLQCDPALNKKRYLFSIYHLNDHKTKGSKLSHTGQGAGQKGLVEEYQKYHPRREWSDRTEDSLRDR